MNEPTYRVDFDSENDYYIFESIGTNGIIHKVVAFNKMEENLYNLGFGDYDLQSRTVNDTNVSDNGDMIKVLATVISIAVKFLSESPMIYIHVEGSNNIRTQLYQRIINRNYDYLIRSYKIYGLINGILEQYEINKSYESFMIIKLL